MQIPLSIVLLTILIALGIGGYTGIHLGFLKLTEISEEQREDGKLRDQTLALLRADQLQSRLEGAQNMENLRTIQFTLDTIKSLLENKTND